MSRCVHSLMIGTLGFNVRESNDIYQDHNFVAFTMIMINLKPMSKLKCEIRR